MLATVLKRELEFSGGKSSWMRGSLLCVIKLERSLCNESLFFSKKPNVLELVNRNLKKKKKRNKLSTQNTKKKKKNKNLIGIKLQIRT